MDKKIIMNIRIHCLALVVSKSIYIIYISISLLEE